MIIDPKDVAAGFIGLVRISRGIYC